MERICLLTLLVLVLTATVGASSPESLQLYLWPLTSTSPIPFALIDTSALNSGSSPNGKLAETIPILSLSQDLTLPPTSHNDEKKFVRVGFFGSGKSQDLDNWRGTATSTSVLSTDPKNIKITLQVGATGNVISASVSRSSTAPAGATVVRMVEGPKPFLNRPVVLTPEGKVPGGEKEEQKSFLQKYWWAIALFLVIQVVAGGGGKE
ncbi:hypothetical protein K402DRAFT_403949 [Aulographum hederae CBS 113979]|uniref:Uncharacterized protein n=1 Tax=Aulographum hederae CBS 113979 TaxID=1176131 RepID=A0A6G1H234_9PEZI|nr:hypothetical protein K402DRAFT_403949 [Aulographum hederae CBS 113979]